MVVWPCFDCGFGVLSRAIEFVLGHAATAGNALGSVLTPARKFIWLKKRRARVFNDVHVILQPTLRSGSIQLQGRAGHPA
jgi:hypothetical protein